MLAPQLPWPKTLQRYLLAFYDMDEYLITNNIERPVIVFIDECVSEYLDSTDGDWTALCPPGVRDTQAVPGEKFHLVLSSWQMSS